MRFHQLPVGTRFEYAGEIHTKTGPLVASSETTGRQRVLPRSATVRPLGGEAFPDATAEAEPCYPLGAVTAALDAYHETCLEAVANVSDPQLATQLRVELERARQAFTDTLSRAEARPLREDAVD